MLNDKTVQDIRVSTQAFWDQEVQKQTFISSTVGKEMGHRIADTVDEQTTSLLGMNYETCFEHGTGGKERARSMGDVWLKENNIFHPINVKTGRTNSKGQPNMTAMGKLLASLLASQIDSYYLLIIKLDITQQPDLRITPIVYFVDMLDYLDYMTFQSGPGQIMMQETKFYAALNAGVQLRGLTLKDKVAQLFVMLERAEQQLIVNREKRLRDLLQTHARYLQTPTHAIDQSHLDLRSRKTT